MAVPNTFATDTGTIPLSQLDANFSYYDAAYDITSTQITFTANPIANVDGTSLYSTYYWGSDSNGSARYASILKNYNSPFDFRIRASNSSTSVPLIFESSNVAEAGRFDAAGNFGIGRVPTASDTWAGGATIPILDIAKSAGFPVILSKGYSTTPNQGGIIVLAHSKSATVGTQTATANGDTFGSISFEGVNSSSAAASGGYIQAIQDSTAGATYIPSALTFYTGTNAAAPVERLRITSDGYLRMDLGSGGIQFGGDTAAANALDDYEEGTWTPTYAPTTGAFTSVTYDAQTSGRYTKIGNVVCLQGTLRTDAITVGTAAGGVKVGGLPFTAISSVPNASVSVGYSAAFGGDDPNGGITISNTSTIGLYYKATSNGDSVELDVADLGTSANQNYVIFQVFYTV